MIATLFSVLLVASEPSAATTAEVQAPVATEAAEPDKKICKREQVTGQIQGTKRVCLTAEQWKARRDAASRAKR